MSTTFEAPKTSDLYANDKFLDRELDRIATSMMCGYSAKSVHLRFLENQLSRSYYKNGEGHSGRFNLLGRFSYGHDCKHIALTPNQEKLLCLPVNYQMSRTDSIKVHKKTLQEGTTIFGNKRKPKKTKNDELVTLHMRRTTYVHVGEKGSTVVGFKIWISEDETFTELVGRYNGFASLNEYGEVRQGDKVGDSSITTSRIIAA